MIEAGPAEGLGCGTQLGAPGSASAGGPSGAATNTPAGGRFATAADRTAVVAGVDVDRVAALVAACPAVAGLTGGGGGLGTYLPGRRVPGVVVHERADLGAPELEVHVVARYGPTMSEVAGQVRQALAALAPGSPVHVVVDDIVDIGAPTVFGVW